MRAQGSKQSQKYIPLRLPHFALLTEKCFRAFLTNECGPLFNEFIYSAKRKRHSRVEIKNNHFPRESGSILWSEGVFEKLMCSRVGAKKQNAVGSEGAGRARL